MTPLWTQDDVDKTKAAVIALSTGQSVFTVTNNLVRSTSHAAANLESVDVTAHSAVAVCTASTITVTLNAVATADAFLFWHLVD